MYVTCAFCRSPFGRNAALELFPVGGRVAFDPRNGRLWVICARCGGWNLAPIEERLDVIECCERQYRGARTRSATENIGLARIAPTMELVRVGRASRRELASWRYGPKLRRRRTEMSMLVGASVAVAIGVGVGGVSGNLFGLNTILIGGYGYSMMLIGTHRWQRIARIDTGDERFVDVRRQDLSRLRFGEIDGERSIEVHHRTGSALLRGAAAIAAARAIMPWTNRSGGSARQVDAAVTLLGADEPDTTRWPRRIASDSALAAGVPLASLSPEHRLALEMSANDDVERRAMAGELALLQRAWRDAEAIAGIADGLLVPPAVQHWLDRHRVPRSTGSARE